MYADYIQNNTLSSWWVFANAATITTVNATTMSASTSVSTQGVFVGESGNFYCKKGRTATAAAADPGNPAGFRIPRYNQGAVTPHRGLCQYGGELFAWKAANSATADPPDLYLCPGASTTPINLTP